MSNKIVKLEVLSKLRKEYIDKKIVLCHGAFDIIHPYHIDHLEDSKKQGDILVVTITADKFITKKSKVFFNEHDRARQLAALELVDYVSIVSHETALPVIDELKPDIYSKGKEFKPLYDQKSGSTVDERHLVEVYGGKMFFTNTAAKSSTKLAYFSGLMSFADEDKPYALEGSEHKFIDLSPTDYTLEQIQEFIEVIKDKKVCVIGETIIDSWIQDTILGISEGYGCLSGRRCYSESHIGGAGIVASHISNFTPYVDLYTNWNETYNESNINPIPKTIQIKSLSSAKIFKMRFMDNKSKRVIYHHKHLEYSTVEWELLKSLDDYDIIVVVDFGHSLISDGKATWISTKAPWLAVQTQTNQDNFGFNLITKYPKANYINMSRKEAELVARVRDESIETLLESFIIKTNISYNTISITDGAKGSILGYGDYVVKQPSLACNILESTGCGDAFFSLSSLVLGCGFSNNLAILSGNIGAAIMSQRIGNYPPINKKDFLTVFKIVT